ncbi:hypothetical protein RDI58_014708 [Solanum bulbocastanum]|uniref:RRM domain-containing protein n=1 Tax=Solanum bulbocastanum TaxID=147425 RepID=A0AAN8TCV2_SOLBU
MVGGRPEATLPPDASSTLFVEDLPEDCTRREVSRILLISLVSIVSWPILVFPFTLVFPYIFRPFGGYKEVRLVPKGSKHAGANPLNILCFVDFTSPHHAAAAMDALQGELDTLFFLDMGTSLLKLCIFTGTTFDP